MKPMVVGLGIDMIEVERVASKISKEQGFRETVFSKNEIAYCEPRPNKFEHYAARFAAKEAFLKAMGTGWAKGIAFNEIEIYNDENGRPLIHLLGGTKKTLGLPDSTKLSVSLSHLKTIASAVVIIEN